MVSGASPVRAARRTSASRPEGEATQGSPSPSNCLIAAGAVNAGAAGRQVGFAGGVCRFGVSARTGKAANLLIRCFRGRLHQEDARMKLLVRPGL